jgi:SAM-dependent methyltransferase
MKEIKQKFDSDFFQKVYEEEDWYGNAAAGRCPGTRLFPLYERNIEGKVLDVGCGRGDVVNLLRSKGFEADGIDQINLDNGMIVGSILEPFEDGKYDTMICIDVIEHIEKEYEDILFENLSKSKTQIFAIHNGPSITKGEDIHVNKRSWSEWQEKIETLFEIKRKIRIHAEQYLYVTEPKQKR